jgi:hypothetical protein
LVNQQNLTVRIEGQVWGLIKNYQLLQQNINFIKKNLYWHRICYQCRAKLNDRLRGGGNRFPGNTNKDMSADKE